MKTLLSTIILIVFLAGCAQKTQIEVDGEPNKVEQKEQIKEKEQVKEKDDENKTIVNVENEVIKVAIIYPSKIVGKYSYDMINSINAYLLNSNKQFELKTYDTFTQDKNKIEAALLQINNDGYKNVVALFTESAYESIEIDKTMGLKIYFPIINKKNIVRRLDNIYFGGVDYEEQLKVLLQYSKNRVLDYYDDSIVGRRLNSYLKKNANLPIIEKEVNDKNEAYKYIIKDYRLNNATLFLNTPVIKTSMFLSLIRANQNISPANILSTQINYIPLIFSLTQVLDRKNFIVANSIGKIDDSLIEKLKLLDVDVEYNYIAYSSLVGIDFFVTNANGEKIEYKMVDNQLKNKIKLYKSVKDSFVQIK